MFGKSSYTRKIENFAKLAIVRISILKKQHSVRCSIARSDVVQLLNLGHRDRVLLRVEQVIKEQNTLDVLDMVEKYCNLIIKRVSLLKSNSECPEELNEAISSLIFAASRCGELPELQEMRIIFTSIFGKNYIDSAIELKNDCKVNPKIMKKLSTRRPSMENRQDLVKQIAAFYGIEGLAENADTNIVKDKSNKDKERHKQSNEADRFKYHETCLETRLSMSEVQELSESTKTRLSIRNLQGKF